MIKNINFFNNTIFNLDPKRITYCTYPSKYSEFTQFKLDRLHPHAGRNRGFFKEDEEGRIKIVKTNWDKPGIKFENLPEFIALSDHYFNKKKWRYSEFAKRLFIYLKSGNIKNNFNKNDKKWKTSKFNMRLLKYVENNNIYKSKNLNQILIERENEINLLFENILKKKIWPCSSKKIHEKAFINNISINLGGKSKILFNNRGVHRLSIAKILNFNYVPVKVTVAKNLNVLRKFYTYNK